jgi:hypothetical protein
MTQIFEPDREFLNLVRAYRNLKAYLQEERFLSIEERVFLIKHSLDIQRHIEVHYPSLPPEQLTEYLHG